MANFFFPPGATVTIAASGLTGATAPISALEVAGVNPSGNLVALPITTGGAVKTDSSATTQPISGAVSVSNFPATQAVSGTFWQATQPISGSVSVSNFPSSQAVTGTFWQTTQPISGTVSATQGTAAAASGAWMNKITDGTNVSAVKAASTVPAATDPALVVSMSPNSSDPGLGSVAAGTAATKAYMMGGIFNTTLPTLTTGQQAGVQLDSSGRQIIAPLATSSIVTVNNPTAANLLATVSLAASQTLATVTTVGAVTSITNALPTGTNVIGFTKQGGRAQANAPVYNNYGTTNVLTSAYTQLIASTTTAATFVDIFDSSGQGMILATGTAGSEVVLAYVPPGGDQIVVTIPASTRIAIKALTANATSGYILLNLYN
jgi:hypothetical protein